MDAVGERAGLVMRVRMVLLQWEDIGESKQGGNLVALRFFQWSCMDVRVGL